MREREVTTWSLFDFCRPCCSLCDTDFGFSLLEMPAPGKVHLALCSLFQGIQPCVFQPWRVQRLSLTFLNFLIPRWRLLLQLRPPCKSPDCQGYPSGHLYGNPSIGEIPVALVRFWLVAWPAFQHSGGHRCIPHVSCSWELHSLLLTGLLVCVSETLSCPATFLSLRETEWVSEGTRVKPQGSAIQVARV